VGAGRQPLAQCDGFGACGSCVAEQLPLEVQVNLFFLLERSNVTNVNFEDLKQTLGTFFNDANQTELGASLTFVPKDASGNGTGVAANSCNIDLYTPVHVGLQSVPTQASVLISAMNGQSYWPGSIAPLHGALFAVLNQATQHQDAHPERRVAVVLIGAGTPSGCAGGNDNIAELAFLAQSAVSYNGVRTFTVAMPSSNIPNLDQIAAYGDTVQSYPSVVSSTEPLYAVEAKARGCTYPLPALAGNAPLDPARTNIEHTSGDTSVPPALIPRVSGENDCGNQPGYYFDEPSNPTQTVFCPASCTALEADTGAALKLLHGCPAVSN